jgi:ABC-2 type transport system permease protein
LIALTPLLALVRKDLRLFFVDRRAVLMSFVAPIAIASFFGSIFAAPGGRAEPARIVVAIADEDASAVSHGIVAGAQTDRSLRISLPTADEAREAVRRGRTSVAVIIPRGFGEAAGRAFLGGGEKPPLQLLYDPSRGAELAMVRGILTEHVMRAVSAATLGGGREITRPYRVQEQAMTAGAGVAFNSYAHAFAGMGVQFLLFATANLGIEILLERQRGLWKRLRSAPISRLTLIVGKTASMTLVALTTLLVAFGFAAAVFGVRIHGSLPGFLGVSVACALMAATFGLLVAAIGRTPAATRGVTTLAVLMMVMLGGAWVPTFLFPEWLQRLTVVLPARWAVDGLDAMTWRGLGWQGAVMPALALLGFATIFGAAALRLFRWEEA